MVFFSLVVVGCLDRKHDCVCERISVVGDGCECVSKNRARLGMLV